MEEVVDPLLAAVVRLGLRDLVVVVRELQVVPARVNVHVVAHQVGRHHAALDVPPRPPAAPRARPRRLAALAFLPHREVGGVPLLARLGGERALRLRHLRLGRLSLRRLELRVRVATRAHLRDVHVHRAVRRVREALGDELLDERDNLRHVLGDAGERVGRPDAEGGHVLHELRLEAARVRVEDLVVGHLRAGGREGRARTGRRERRGKGGGGRRRSPHRRAPHRAPPPAARRRRGRSRWRRRPRAPRRSSPSPPRSSPSSACAARAARRARPPRGAPSAGSRASRASSPASPRRRRRRRPPSPSRRRARGPRRRSRRRACSAARAG